MVNELKGYHANVDIDDPWVDPNEAEHEYGIELTVDLIQGKYDAVIIAVAHNEFREMGANKNEVDGRI